MSKYRKLLILVAVVTMSAILLTSSPVLSRADAIIWSVEGIVETLEQGESRVLDVSFHSDIELHDVELFTSDEIWPLIMASPEVLPLVEQGSDTTIQIRIFVPTTAESGIYEGTLHLKQGHRTYPQVLKIRLSVSEATAGMEVIECAPSGDVEVTENPDTGAKAASNQVLAIFDSGMTAEDTNTLLDEYSMRIVGQITVLDVYQIEIPTGADPWAFADLLSADSRVALAGVNDVGEADLVPSDPAWQISGRRWAFEKIHAPEAWDISTGSSDVTLAIIDSGVDLNHDEFAGRLLLGIDYIWHLIPWDVWGHGTKVAGIMAAQGNGGNTQNNGIAGMCWNSDLKVIKAMEFGHGFSLDCIAAIIEASIAGVKVINISSGWYDPSSVTKWLFEGAVNYADEAKALVVASAGNQNRDEETSQHYPSIVPKVLSVGATDDNDDRAVWPEGQASNFGSTVDVAAPGDSIYTTTINGYIYGSGTSFAAPFASGLAALIWSIDYDDDGDFDLLPTDVKEIIELTADPDVHCFYIPDPVFGGGRIDAYNALRQSQVELLGWRLTQLTDTDTEAWRQEPVFNGDGTKIAFASVIDGDMEIFIVNSDGSGLTQLTHNAAWDYNPSISGDGTKIAFTSNVDGDMEIFIVNSDGSGLTQLTHNAASDYDPSINRDGTKIAFTSNVDGDMEIFIIDSDGSGLTQLTNNTAQDYDPSISGDGTKIIFTSYDQDPYLNIFIMNLDGTGLTQLTLNTSLDVSPSVSFDGTKIAFESNVDGDNEIFIINSDGSGLTQLTNNTAWDYDPSISSDGTKIAFGSEVDGNSDIFIMNSDGSGLTQLTYGKLFFVPDMISGDGTKVVFHSQVHPLQSDILLLEYSP